MDEKVLNMTGYQFENYISELLKKMGFEVEVTQYTNDGGIDLIATCEKPIFSGKYIIQCKKWSTSVGQPEVRDLYGVVMDQRANKGVLITTSDFTAQAYNFAKGKNLELINGDLLRVLNGTNICDINDKKENIDFPYRNDRYNYLKKKINEEPNELQNYVDLIQYLRGCIKERKDSKALITEYIDIVEKMISRCFKKASKIQVQNKKEALLLQAEAYIYLGDLAKATEILVRNDRFFVYIYPDDHHISCETGHYSRYPFSYAWNLYVAYKHIGYQKGCKLILSKFGTGRYLNFGGNEKIKQCRFIENVCGKRFIYPIVYNSRGHFIPDLLCLEEVLNPQYFFDKYYSKDNEACIKEIDEVLRFNGIT